MKEYYIAGELAAMVRVSPRTIRFYDQKNLLTPVGYSEGKYRLYGKIDEALSALDTDHEERILQNIRVAMQSGILLIITHRRESLKNLGKFMCLELS